MDANTWCITSLIVAVCTASGRLAAQANLHNGGEIVTAAAATAGSNGVNPETTRQMTAEAFTESFVAQAVSAHPRLLLTAPREARMKQWIAQDALVGAAAEMILEEARTILDADALIYKKTGPRLLGVSRELLRRTLWLGMAYRLTGERPFARAAVENMATVSQFSDWNPRHFLDVSVMTAGVAIGYDWCHDALTAAEEGVIRHAIIAKGLEPSFERTGTWWIRSPTNWNQVCHGGLVLGALAVWEEHPEIAARVTKRAIECLPIAMAAYEPDGAYPEGPSYWGFGSTYAILMIDALQTVLGSDFDLPSDAFLDSADFINHLTGTIGWLYFNYSDGYRFRTFQPAMLWMAVTRQDPQLLHWDWQQLERVVEGRRLKHAAMLPFFLLWLDGATHEAVPPEERFFRARGPQPLASFRSSWGDRGTFVGIKGGNPSYSHAHMDVGSFVLDADDVRWGIDLGSQAYHSIEKAGVKDRWAVLRHSNLSHNTLVVNGERQEAKSHSPLLSYSADADHLNAVFDLLPAYGGQLAEARRGAQLVNGRCVIIQDEIRTLDQALTEVRWAMLTEAAISVATPSVAVLQQQGRGSGRMESLHCTILSPAGASWSILNPNDIKQPYDQIPEQVRQLVITVSVPADTRERLVVHMRPGTAPTEPPPAVMPLDHWEQSGEPHADQ